MESIENEFLAVEIDLHGGALHSVTDKRSGRQLLWQGAENSWKSRDVVIFPFVARLKDKSYTCDGKPYSMDNHGLARYNTFAVCFKRKDALSIRLDSDAQTLLRYPFAFSFFVTYELKDNALRVAFKADNLSEKTMYFGLGAHPAYQVGFDALSDFDDISGNYIAFEEPQNLVRYVLNESGDYIRGVTPSMRLQRLPLSKRLFQTYNTLIFGGAHGRLSLHKRDGTSITFDVGDVPYLAFWSHKTRGNYVCVEPWCGLPDFENCDSELKNKEGINALESGKSFEYAYTTIYND